MCLLCQLPSLLLMLMLSPPALSTAPGDAAAAAGTTNAVTVVAAAAAAAAVAANCTHRAGSTSATLPDYYAESDTGCQYAAAAAAGC